MEIEKRYRLRSLPETKILGKGVSILQGYFQMKKQFKVLFFPFGVETQLL